MCTNKVYVKLKPPKILFEKKKTIKEEYVKVNLLIYLILSKN